MNRKNYGVVLPSALILLVSLTLVAVTVAYRSTMNEVIAANQRDAVNTMFIAESGIEKGIADIRDHNVKNNVESMTAFCTDVGNGNFTPPSSSISSGQYVTSVDCTTNPTNPVLISVGQLVSGTEVLAERQLEVVLEAPAPAPPGGGPGNSNFSFLANDFIEISSMHFVGPLIHIHTFGGVKVSGAPNTCATWDEACKNYSNLATAPPGYLTARWYDPKTYEMVTSNDFPWDLNGPSYDGLGTPDDNPYDIFADYGVADGDLAALEEKAKEIIPHIYPPDWQQYATVELSADCKVYAGQAATDYTPGELIWDVSADGTWNQWTCSSQSAWTVKTEGVLHDAFYYVHGNVKAGGSGEKQTNGVWNSTIVTTGYFESGCCPAFGTWNQPTGNPDADNLFLLAGNDIIVQSSPEQVIEGVIAAHREVKLDGSQSHYRGMVIAENGLWHDYDLYPDSDVEVHDNEALGIDVQNETDRSKINNVINSNTVLEGTGIGFGGAGLPGSTGPLMVEAAAWREVLD